MSWYITPDDIDQAKSIGVSESALYQRVRVYGWNIKKAITTPPKKQKPRGTYKCYAAIAKKNGIPYRNMISRIQKGWEPIEAATKPVETRKELKERIRLQATVHNRILPEEYVMLARKNGIAYNTFRMRVRGGMSYEDAATRPLRYIGGSDDA